MGIDCGNEEIKIKLHNTDSGITALTVIIFVLTVLFLTFTIRYFSPVSLLITLLLCGLFIAFIYLCDYRPMVIWSDGNYLYWKCVCRLHSLKLSDITDICCKPYSVHSRYETQQRIRLTLCTKIDMDNEIEFNDSVDTGKLLDEKLSGINADVPLIQLYDYLRSNCCLN